MERLKAMKESLTSVVQGQMANLGQVDAHELGEVVDMIKDLEEAMYYCSIVKAMEKAEKEEEILASLMKKEGKEDEYHRSRMFYPPYPYPPIINYYHERMPDPYYKERMERDMDKDRGRMYYSGGRMGYPGDTMYYSGGSSNGSGSSSRSGMNGGSRNYEEYNFPIDMMNMRDSREGRAPQSRRSYMESKEMHKDQAHKMKDLEKYMQDLGQDIIEMIQDASPEEKKTLEKKMTTLASKVAQLNA